MGFPVLPPTAKNRDSRNKEQAVEIFCWLFGVFVFATIVGTAWLLLYGAKPQ